MLNENSHTPGLSLLLTCQAWQELDFAIVIHLPILDIQTDTHEESAFADPQNYVILASGLKHPGLSTVVSCLCVCLCMPCCMAKTVPACLMD